MSDLCPLPGGTAREIHKPPARNAVSSELHLKVAMAGNEHWQVAAPALLACASLDQRYIPWSCGRSDICRTFLSPSQAVRKFLFIPSFPPYLPNTFKSVFLTKASRTQLHKCSKKQLSDHPYRSCPDVRLNISGKLSSHSFIGMEVFYTMTAHSTNTAPSLLISPKQAIVIKNKNTEQNMPASRAENDSWW